MAERGQLMGDSKSGSNHGAGILSGMEFASGTFGGEAIGVRPRGLLGGLAPVGERGGRDYRLARGERLLPGIKNMTIDKYQDETGMTCLTFSGSDMLSAEHRAEAENLRFERLSSH